MGPLLRVEDLRKTYVNRQRRQVIQALDGVSFDLSPGETLGVVGESGSGKSTLARIVLRLVGADGGVLEYEDIDVLQPSRQDARYLTSQIQIVFQDPHSAMNPRHSVRRALAEALRASGDVFDDADSRMIELLDAVGISSDKLRAYPHQLSGGQRQRIAIARALAVNPRLIVADECVSALDVSVQSSILNLLLELQEEKGLSYLFISHDLSVVYHMSDRIIVMREGRIVESGLPDEIMSQPAEAYTRELLASIPGTERRGWAGR